VKSVRGDWPDKLENGLVLKVHLTKNGQVLQKVKTLPIAFSKGSSGAESIVVNANASFEIPEAPKQEDYELQVFVCRKKSCATCLSSTKRISNAGLFVHGIMKHCETKHASFEQEFGLFDSRGNMSRRFVTLSMSWDKADGAAEEAPASAESTGDKEAPASDESTRLERTVESARVSQKASKQGSQLKKIAVLGLVGGLLGIGAQAFLGVAS